jgi:predicted  nucleic acid-binding Zn-ribbon protein
MKNQYQILADLKRVDEKVVRLQRDRDRIPQEIGVLDAACQKRREEFTKAKEQFDATEKKLRAAESDLREREDRLRKAEGKMMEVKTNEEYQAAIKENDSQKKEKAGLEDQVLQLITEVEEQRRQLKEVEKTVQAYESTVKEDKKKLETEQAKLEALLKEQLERRDSISSQLAPETASLYSRLAAQFKGMAVATAENGMCLSCNIKIRPQLYNEVLGYKAIHRCPSCGKILIVLPAETGRESGLSAD